MKLRGMLEALRETDCGGDCRKKESLRGGLSGTQPSETYKMLPSEIIIVKSYFICNRKEKG